MELQPTNPQCPQCGKFHPPLQEGEDCPLKGTVDDQNDNTQNQININKFVSTIKSIVLSNIDKKDIKDIDKFQNHLILELNKIIENYSEE